MVTSDSPCTLSTTLSVSGRVLAQEFDGVITILDTHSEQYFSLDDVGTRMWEVIIETPTLRQAHARLVDEFAAEPERLERDLLAFATELVESGLMVAGEGDGTTE
jgi:hypothetical protein